MRKVYESVCALESDTLIYHIESLVLEIDGEIHEIPLVLEQFRAYLLEIAPEENLVINHFCNEIKKVTQTEMMIGRPKSFKAYLHAITKGRKFLSVAIKYLNVTVEKHFEKLKNDKLRKIIYHLMPSSMSMFALLMMLGSRMAHNGGFPEGGARDMIKRMQTYFLSLGGHISFNTQITDIIVENHKVIEIRSHKNVYPLTHIIAACDMYNTIHHMLKGEYPHPVLNRMLEESLLFDSIMLISIGLSKSFDIPSSATFEIPDSLYVGGETYAKQYHIRSFDFDISLAPLGHSSIMVTLSAPFDFWHHLKTRDEVAYQRAKMDVANKMIAVLENKYPNISNAIEVIDVATPSTYYRLNNLYKGSFEGFMPVPAALKEKIDTKIPGIDNLYLAGQWVTPGGGIPPAIISGIETAHQIIKEK
jgi:phytoene desaturase